MNKDYKIVFDKVIIKQLKQATKNNHIRKILFQLIDKIKERGPYTGELLDSKLQLYEVKVKSPPIRIYYQWNSVTKEIYIFEYGMKTSETKQQKLIDKLRKIIFKVQDLLVNIFLLEKYFLEILIIFDKV